MILNYLNQAKYTRTVSFTSGKGGVGKSTIAANLAYLFAQSGKKVLILDSDFGMANIDIILGVRAKGDISEIISGDKKLNEIILEVSKNLFLIPGGSGLAQLQNLNNFQRKIVLDSINDLNMSFDYLFVDTSSGISPNVLQMNSAAQEIAIILTPDPSSFTDAYGLLKSLKTNFKENNFSIICNMIKDESEGRFIFKKFEEVVNRFYHDINLNYLGSIPADLQLRKANLNQRLIVKQNSEALSTVAFHVIADRLNNQLTAPNLKSGLQFYFFQAMGTA